MKNHTIKNIGLGALLLCMLPVVANAQVSVQTQQPLITQYIENDAATKKTSWWNLLGRKLSHSIDKPHAEVSVAEMQNIIFFASNYKNKVKLRDALPSLLDVFKHHENEQFRMMALSAINAIGHRPAMIELRKAAVHEPSEKVKKLANAAVKDFFAIK